MENSFTNEINNDTLDLENNLVEEEVMPTKFYNFNCIYLYTYIDEKIAYNLTQNVQINQQVGHIINTPIELYENPYIASVFNTSYNKALVAFAINVQSGIYDELNLELDNQIKREGKPVDEIKREVAVIRKLKTYKQNEKGKIKYYISYIIQNQNAIKNICPLCYKNNVNNQNRTTKE